MSENICAPNKYDAENKTCFTLEQLIEMCSAYNRYLIKNKLSPQINHSGPNNLNNPNDLIKIKPDKKYLLIELKKRFDRVCHGDEICITKQSFMNEIVNEMREEFDHYTFRSKGPDNPIEWLSTADINSVLMQYERIYPDFKFLGAVPLDCVRLPFCSLYQIDFKQYLDHGIKQLGIILNLDKFGQPGSHWVSLYINLGSGEIYFCDSNGKPPPDFIKQTINQFQKFYQSKTGKQVIYKYNKIAYQEDQSECGIYSCNFIIRKLSGETFDDIVKNYLGFKEINSCRNVYFRNKPSKYKSHFSCDPHNSRGSRY